MRTSKFRRSLLWTVIGMTAGMAWGAMNASAEVTTTLGSIGGGAAGGAFWGSIAAFVVNRFKA